jgi:hypothetical protein
MSKVTNLVDYLKEENEIFSQFEKIKKKPKLIKPKETSRFKPRLEIKETEE